MAKLVSVTPEQLEGAAKIERIAVVPLHSLDVDSYEIVITEIQSHWLSFEVYEVLGKGADGKRIYNREEYQSSPDPVNSRENAQKFLEGSIKWDGCANFTMEDEPIHFCGLSDAESFGRILPTIYRLASELIPSWEG